MLSPRCVFEILAAKKRRRIVEVEVVFSQRDVSKRRAGRSNGRLGASEVSAGINLLQEDESHERPGLTPHRHSRGRSQGIGYPRGCWEIPTSPRTSSGLRSSRGYNKQRGGGFKPGSPQRGRRIREMLPRFGRRVRRVRRVRRRRQVDSSTQSFISATT